MNSIYQPQDWMLEEEYLKHLAGERTVDDTLVMRLKVRLVKHILDSHLFFERSYAKCIEKETSELIFMDPWYGQAGLDYTAECQRRSGYGVRIIEIKPRQIGWTTHLISRALWTCLHPRRNAIVFVPDIDVGNRLMERAGTIINNLPEWLRPMRQIDNRWLIKFDNPDPKKRPYDPGLQSSFGVLVPSDFRGASNLNFVVLSEYAKYHKALHGRVQEFLDALLSGMGEGPETEVYIDTSPMGHDLFYEPAAMEACERNPNWVKRWYRKGRRTVDEIANGALGDLDHPEEWAPWFSRWIDHVVKTTKDDHPKGELPALTAKLIDWLTRSDERMGRLDKYGGEQEIELVEKHGATLGNIMWRRNKIDKNLGPDWRYRLLAFQQEQSLTHLECFVSYGVTPFDPVCLEAIHRQVIDPPPVAGIMRKDQDGIYCDNGYVSQWEQVRMWETPQPGMSYLMPMDLAHAYENVDADDSFAHVFKRTMHGLVQVACYQAKVPPYRLREQVYLLHKFYNDALLAIETEDGIGYSMVRELFDMGATNQYYWKRIDADIPKVTDYLGWETNPRTRPIMQETLVEEVNKLGPGGKPEPGIVIRDWTTYTQFTNAERQPNGTIEGSGKTHDDALLCAMIGVTVNRDLYHSFSMPRREEHGPPDNRSLMQAGGRYESAGVGSSRSSRYIEDGLVAFDEPKENA